ncbi:MAG: hypothetical protein M3R17_10960 [Bacteroidota bacterium]|nr:hypothetical protein [Bacteroidota bacterium]
MKNFLPSCMICCMILVSGLKLNAQFESFLWATRVGGTFPEESSSIGVDASGNIYTTGFYRGTVDFNQGAGVFNLSSNTSTWYDAYVTKVDASGNFLWAKSIGGSLNDIPSGLVIDNLGNVIITGLFTGAVDFDPGAPLYAITAAGSEDIFVWKLDASGNFVWAKNFGGASNEKGNAIATDATGNIYTTGVFNSTCDFDPSGVAYNLVAAAQDIFVSKLDASGNFVWAKKMGGTANDVGYSSKLDASNNVYISGSFETTADFDPGAPTVNMVAVALRDIFVSKLDNAGNYTWVKTMGGTGNEHGYGITIDGLGNVLCTAILFGGPIKHEKKWLDMNT